MTIGIDASRANIPKLTGTERYAFELLMRLPILMPTVRFVFYLREPLLPHWGQLPDNVQTRVLHWPPRIFWNQLRLPWEILWHKPDIIFFPASAIPWLTGTTTVTTIHDVAFEHYPELYAERSALQRFPLIAPLLNGLIRVFSLGRYGITENDYQRWAIRRAIKACWRIFTVSEYTAHELVTLFHPRIDQVVVIPSAVPQPDIAHEKTTGALSIDHGRFPRPFYLYVGRLERKKNIGILLQAYRQYREHVSNPADLILAGSEGNGWAEFRAAVPANWFGQCIHVLGWIDEDTKARLLSSALATIHIAEYEGFGLPPLESCSYGTPVIASRAGALPEVLGSAAVYVDHHNSLAVAQAMTELAEDTAERERLGVLGRERARLFTWDHTAQRTAREFQKMIDLKTQAKSVRVKTA